MSEGSLFFEGRGKVQESLKRITQRLNDLRIPYAVVGGMALFLHGFRRYTEDIDILVTHENLQRIHKELSGFGYRAPFEKSKNLRDSRSGVTIEFLIAGNFSDDGQPKEIAFPDPDFVAETRDQIQVLNLAMLISLKLASGMSGEGRTKDLADVEELIKLLHLPESLVEALNPFVRERFAELWRQLHAKPKRYLMLWRNKGLTSDARSINDMIATLQGAAAELAAMAADGVVLDPEGGTEDDYAHLVCTDRLIAEKYGMEDESEYFGLDEDDESEESDAVQPTRSIRHN